MAIRPSTCCCFKARTGALILASIGLLGAAVGTVVCSLLLPSQDAVVTTFEYVLRQELRRGMIDEDDYNGQMRISQILMRSMPYVVGTCLFASVFSLVLNSMLLHGIVHRRPRFMLPWLIADIVFLAVSTLWVAGLGFGLTASFSEIAFNGLVACFLLLGVCFYFWSVVRSVYWDIREGPLYREFGSRATFVA